MANNTHRVLRDIDDTEIDFKSPVDEDLMARLVGNLFSLATMIDGQPNKQFQAQSDGVPTDDGATSTLTIDNITEGVFERDDQYNDKFIKMTSGAASGNGIDSRFPITDSDESGQTFTVGLNPAGDNLNEAGVIDNDTFEVMGHVHDGTDGEIIFWDDIVGQSGLEENSAIYEVSVGGGGGPFSTTITHGLGRTPTQISAWSYWKGAGCPLVHYHAHWTASEVNLYFEEKDDFDTDTHFLFQNNTHNAIANTDECPTLPSNSIQDVDVINVGASSFDLNCTNTGINGTYKVLLKFS